MAVVKDVFSPDQSVRLFRILLVFLRHGALFPLESRGPGWRLWLMRRTHPTFAGLRPGQRLAVALQELGPTYIKFGQALSTRPDLVGEEVAADLSDLHDRLPPFPFAEARAIIETELDRPLTELYASFEETPVAAASIAQCISPSPPRARWSPSRFSGPASRPNSPAISSCSAGWPR